VEHWIEIPLRQQVSHCGTPDEISSLRQRCANIERDIEAGLATGSINIDDRESPLLKLAVLKNRRDLATVLERQRQRTFHPQILERLDAQLKPYDDLMYEHWYEDSHTERLPRLTDFMSLQAALESLGDSLSFSERQFDEKFEILQAPTLLQRDLACYRAHCELREVSLAVAYLDIDHFKQRFNTPYGETIIDRNVLPRFMMCIEAFVFGRGHAYRYGGDEYALLLPGVGQQAAEDALDDLRRRVADLEYVRVKATTTISIGLCVVAPDCFLTNAEVEHRAEEAKNFAKNAGRNRIAAYTMVGSKGSVSVVRSSDNGATKRDGN
jgi:diguanylate cyclase (GGDEF)-like protein